MADINFAIARTRATPLIQAGFTLLLGWLGIGACRLFKAEPGTEYIIVFSIIVFYCMLNAIVSLAYESFLRYTMPSIYLDVAIVAILLLSVKQVTGLSIWSQPEYKMMLTSISLFYVLISFFVRFIRLMYEAASSGL